MRSGLVLGLLGAVSAARFDQFRPQSRNANKYVKATDVAADSEMKLLRRGDMVETATEAVQKIAGSDATFRTRSDHYVGTNGVGHVYFKQNIHGIDIDNAEFNVNVSGINWTRFPTVNSMGTDR